MDYRIDKQGLLNRIGAWDSFIHKKVHLIACGGTALTFLGVKPSTKDVDLIVPNPDEYSYLIGILIQLGYRRASGWGWEKDDGFIFDLFRGKSVHTTELLESPLIKGNHMFVKEFERIYLGILNYYDLIISKLFRGTAVDIDDCYMLVKNKNKDIDFERLKRRFKETASFDVSEDKVNKNFEHFSKVLIKEGLFNGK
ncbi:MAG: DUF6036 family nucleotidyltransferase [Candidatus Omnitrophota bacterium]|nr:hypothetical protein [Candidatus Omnitrophota bacterium]MBU1929669.1 hypothetical protein [Candidatus Omnitrophota bacterium]MBU2035075.1 hypothetical protein [Candidatus Omnitrophota bacterium]MBU2257979.1 hypothetical protein [Candidatus Omnitrophota bacterium]